MRRRVLLVGLVSLAAVVCAAAVWAYDANRPVFRPPIRWSGVSHNSTESSRASIRLVDDNTARLADFPRGTMGSETMEGRRYDCLDRTPKSLYTGTAHWVAQGSGSFTLYFGSSSVPVFADRDGYFLGTTVDWDSARVLECGPGNIEWDLLWDCGYAGHTDAGDLTRACDR